MKKIGVILIVILIMISYGIYKAFFDTNLANLDGRGSLVAEVENPFNEDV